jgi:16S rRNA (uracil1498-N3)-methyltransferase
MRSVSYMARRLFFVPEVRHGRAELHGEAAKHLTKVLRVERGQIYQISDNEHLWLAEVEAAHKETVEFRVKEPLPPPPVEPAIDLFPALIKFDHFEWMIEKATELGVARVQPVIAERSDAGLDRAAEKRMERWRKIALEASQQSRRVRLPVIEPPLPLARAVAAAGSRLIADEEHTTPGLPRNLQPPVSILIGPEGGWTARERELCRDWTPVSLGSTILRAETAAVAAIALTRFALL